MTIWIPVIGASIVVTLMALGILHLSDTVEPGVIRRLCLPIVVGVITFILAVALLLTTM